MIKLICQNCGKEYFVYKRSEKKSKFCSIKCCNLSIIGDNNPSRKYKIEHNCLYCGKKFIAIKRAKYCCSSCQNKDYNRKHRKKYNITPERIESRRKRQSSQEYKEWRRIYRKHKQKTDIKFRINGAMSTQIYTALKNKKGGKKWEYLVGYTVNDLIKHLEKQFNDKMTWNNYGSYWQIDHKIPKSWFDYSSYNEHNFKKCWALENLQPLDCITNSSKNNRYCD